MQRHEGRRSSPPAVTRAGARWRAALFITLVVLAAAALLAPAAMAAGTYVGGPQENDYPIYVANDHSVYTLRFSIPDDPANEQVLQPETEYYVKVRLSPSPEPSGSNNRGFTWNPSTGLWAQERADWVEFPTITTDAAGAYAPGNQWFAFKFGDETKSGTYYILISLQPVVDIAGTTAGTTINNLDPPPVTVVDPSGTVSGATPAFWIHNGIATTASAKRIDAVPAGLTKPIWALSRTEPNLVDEDGNGAVDDEDYGPAGNVGDFVLAVPSGNPFDVRLQSVVWPPVAPPAVTTSDVDIAWGHPEDMIPPAKVTELQAESGNGSVALSWHPADEDDGVTAYRVYRWTDATPIGGVIAYTPQALLLATTTETTYTDTGVVNGEDYYYVVRAVDAATNAGPRCNQVTGEPRIPTILTLDAAATIVPYKGTTTLTVHLTDEAGAPLAGYDVELQKSTDGGVTWTSIGTTGSDGGTAVTPELTRATLFRATWAGAGEYAASTSDAVEVKPKVALGNPDAPRVVKKYVRFRVDGTLRPRHTPGWNKAVRLYCYRKDPTTGKWVQKKAPWCKTVDYLTYSKYRVTIYLGSRGTWKLRAFAPEDAQHAATWSTSHYLTVK